MKTAISAVLFLGVACSGAWADISDSGSLIIGGQAVIAGTTTLQGNAFSVGSSTLIVASGAVGVSTTNVPASAVLFPSGVAKGVLFNPMTTAQRDAISNPAS